MADDKDKIIIIEEEPKPQEKIEDKKEPLGEKQVQLPRKSHKKLFLGVVLVAILLIAAVLAFIFFSNKPHTSKKNVSKIPPKAIKTKSNLDLHFIEGLNLENKGNLKNAIEEFKKSKNYLFLAYLNIAKIYQMQNCLRKVIKINYYTKCLDLFMQIIKIIQKH